MNQDKVRYSDLTPGAKEHLKTLQEMNHSNQDFARKFTAIWETGKLDERRLAVLVEEIHGAIPWGVRWMAKKDDIALALRYMSDECSSLMAMVFERADIRGES